MSFQAHRFDLYDMGVPPIEDKIFCKSRDSKKFNVELKCSFIRFNPDARDFNIFRVINRIYQHLC